jgi:hypothetical protein
MGISAQRTGLPVSAMSVEVTDESIPPETPITNPFVREVSEYVFNQSTM